MKISVGDRLNVLGTIEQDWCDSTYSVRDEEGKLLSRIQGPCYGVCAPCCFWCCNEQHSINEADGVTELGTLRCHWKQQPFDDANGLIGVSCPPDMTTKQKALMVGLLVLIVSPI